MFRPLRLSICAAAILLSSAVISSGAAPTALAADSITSGPVAVYASGKWFQIKLVTIDLTDPTLDGASLSIGRNRP